jgi:hypothetical protein
VRESESSGGTRSIEEAVGVFYLVFFVNGTVFLKEDFLKEDNEIKKGAIIQSSLPSVLQYRNVYHLQMCFRLCEIAPDITSTIPRIAQPNRNQYII